MHCPTYDCLSVMSGVHQGILRNIQEYDPDAYYIHCFNQKLNFEIVYAAIIVDTLEIFDFFWICCPPRVFQAATQESIFESLHQNEDIYIKTTRKYP